MILRRASMISKEEQPAEQVAEEEAEQVADTEAERDTPVEEGTDTPARQVAIPTERQVVPTPVAGSRLQKQDRCRKKRRELLPSMHLQEETT